MIFDSTFTKVWKSFGWKKINNTFAHLIKKFAPTNLLPRQIGNNPWLLQ